MICWVIGDAERKKSAAAPGAMVNGTEVSFLSAGINSIDNQIVRSRSAVVREQLRRRKEFLLSELAHEEETLPAVKQEVGHKFHEAFWMISLVIEQFRTELRVVVQPAPLPNCAGLDQVATEPGHCAPARDPAHIGKDVQ